MSRSDASIDAIAAELLRNEKLLLDPPRLFQVAALLSEDFFEFGASGCIWTRHSGRWGARFHQGTRAD